MNKSCKQCNMQFALTDEDNAFYSKLGINEPSHCPMCRVQRRMAWRNDRSFYQRSCDKTGESFVSTYQKQTPFPVYKPSAWYGEDWDPMDYGQDFDFNRPFFEQWEELMNKVPRLGIDIVGCENSDYCNYCGYDRNCYLDIAGENNEDCYFDLFTKYSKNCVDCTFVYESQLCYELINSFNCYNVRYSMYMENCNDCFFCFDMKGCKDCLFSSNLRQKQYYIFNQPHTKEEYEAKLSRLNLGSAAQIKSYIESWKGVMLKALHRDAYMHNCENCTGNNIKNSKNCQWSFNAINSEDCKYLFDVLDAKNCYDLSYSLYKPEMACELISTLDMKFSAFSMASHHCNDVFYVDMCNSSSNLFGCIALRQAKNCVLNKQYSEENYKVLKRQIIDHMQKTGEWGEFFPSQISPHPYNTTVAQEYMPLTPKQAIDRGLRWGEDISVNSTTGNYSPADDIREISENLKSELLQCKSCTKAFRIIQQELRFYKQQGIPIPMNCPDCRHKNRMKLRTPRQLWNRSCAQCNTKILTAYDPKRNEKVLCEKCYLSAVY